MARVSDKGVILREDDYPEEPFEIPLKKVQGLLRGRDAFTYQCAQGRTLGEGRIVLHGFKSKYFTTTHQWVGFSRGCHFDLYAVAPQ